MWSKGAVVIVKHGDTEMANAIEKSLDIRLKDPKMLTDSERAEYDLLKKAKSDKLRAMIAENEEEYGYNWVPPKWAEKIVGAFALIVYGISVFIDRYLRIKV